MNDKWDRKGHRPGEAEAACVAGALSETQRNRLVGNFAIGPRDGWDPADVILRLSNHDRFAEDMGRVSELVSSRCPHPALRAMCLRTACAVAGEWPPWGSQARMTSGIASDLSVARTAEVLLDRAWTHWFTYDLSEEGRRLAAARRQGVMAPLR